MLIPPPPTTRRCRESWGCCAIRKSRWHSTPFLRPPRRRLQRKSRRGWPCSSGFILACRCVCVCVRARARARVRVRACAHSRFKDMRYSLPLSHTVSVAPLIFASHCPASPFSSRVFGLSNTSIPCVFMYTQVAFDRWIGFTDDMRHEHRMVRLGFLVWVIWLRV